MKIVRVVSAFYPYVTGVAKQAYCISKGLEERGIRSPILTSNFSAEGMPIMQTFDGVPVRRFPVAMRVMQYTITPSMYEEIMREKPGIIHAHGYRSFQSDVSYAASRRLMVPLVVSAHGMAVGYRYIVANRLMRMPYKAYDLITAKRVLLAAEVVVSASRQELAELVQFGVEQEKIWVIPPGVELGVYDGVSVMKRDRPVIIFVGRLTRDRSLETLIRAFQRAVRSIPDLDLVIVGWEAARSFTGGIGYVERLRHLVEKLGLSRNVIFAGPLYGRSLVEAYKSAHVFAYPSLYENFGQTILEAAAAGLPVVSTPVGVAMELVEDGVTGFLVPFGDEEALADKIQALIDDPKLRSKFSSRLRSRVEAGYLWPTILDRYVQMYSTIT